MTDAWMQHCDQYWDLDQQELDPNWVAPAFREEYTEDRRELHAWGTYKGTDRLEELTRTDFDQPEPTDGPFAEPVTEADVRELFHRFVEGSGEAGTPPTLLEFAAWILGKHIRNETLQSWYAECEPAEVVW
jgi:hypothetical protein